MQTNKQRYQTVSDGKKTPIQFDTDTWLIMREDPARPRAVVKRVTDREHCEKYLLLTWDPDPAKWRLHGLYETLDVADFIVTWNNPTPEVPGQPERRRGH